MICSVALSTVPYRLDKPYSYIVPSELIETVFIGARVMVPFAASRTPLVGVVISFDESGNEDNLKSVISVLDSTPIINESHIKTAFFMRERCFCSVYEALHAMVPSGLWYKSNGRRVVPDKYTEIVRLVSSAEDAISFAESRKENAPIQSAMAEYLADFGTVYLKNLLDITSGTKNSLAGLVKSGIAEIIKTEYRWSGSYKSVPKNSVPVLNREQEEVYNKLCKLLNSNEYSVSLLHGVTGSGKTSIYLNLIDKCIKSGKQALFLLPEIALTPQMYNQVCGIFGSSVAVLHSALSPRARTEEWKRINRGDVSVVLGTRSAVFAPLQKIGLVIMDEEHDESYASNNSPYYHTRDVAKYICYKNNAPLVLGSATPDIVTRYNAEIGTYNYFSLKKRYNLKALPEVEIVDMKEELKNGNDSEISSVLKDDILSRIEKGEQSIVFLNRRGTNKLVACEKCGYTYSCPNCSVSLTYHGNIGKLVCHYCRHTITPGTSCPECGGALGYYGTGTQNIEESIGSFVNKADLAPEDASTVIRVDADSVSKAGSHRVLFEQFKQDNIPVMVGTQMVSKGLNFDNVTLVGIVSADAELYSGNYKASEICFSMLTQVIGRSGRGEKPGKAIIQTYTPDNYIIKLAAAQNYDEFYESELKLRHIQNTPPFSSLFSFILKGKNEGDLLRCCSIARAYLSKRSGSECRILGPAALPVKKVNNVFRYCITVTGKNEKFIRKLLSGALMDFSDDKRFVGVSVYARNGNAE